MKKKRTYRGRKEGRKTVACFEEMFLAGDLKITVPKRMIMIFNPWDYLIFSPTWQKLLGPLRFLSSSCVSLIFQIPLLMSAKENKVIIHTCENGE